MPHVLLLGASGGMGRRIAALWPGEVQDAELRLGVRSLQKAGGLGPDAATVVARLNDPTSLRAALAGVAVVINAIGPFAYDPGPLLDACAAAGVHYVDLASEPEFLASVSNWAARHPAAIAVCPGASTMPGTIELAATHLRVLIGCVPASFDVFLSMGSANPLTPGLLASLTLQLGVPLRSAGGGRSYRRLRWRRMHGLGRRLFGRYPSPFDEPGLMVQNQGVPTRFWVGLDRSWIVHALRAASFLRPHFRDRTWISLTERVRPLIGWANWIGGYAGGLRVEALSTTGEVLGAVNFLAKREGLNIPALPSIWAARALLQTPARGLQPLARLVTFAEAAASLRRHGYEVMEEGPTGAAAGR